MFKITGLDKLQKNLGEIQGALKALNGNIAKVKFDPADPQSVAKAIRDMERAVDSKIARYRNNETVRDIAKNLKAKYRASIRAQARKELRRADAGTAVAPSNPDES